MALFKKNVVEEEEELEEEYDEEVDEEEAYDNGLTDYDVYVMSGKEKLLYILLAFVVSFAVGMIFYQNVILAGILSVTALAFPKIRTKQIIKKRKQNLNIQFKDLLYALSSSMSAGRSLESAFRDALRDLEVLYPDPDTIIMQETQYIIRCIETNMTVEDAISQFAVRAHIEDIANFADVIRICKRSGGNLIDVVRSTSQMISDKIETKNEIETVITAKKFESRILWCSPIAMVAVLSTSSPDYMAPVFQWPGIGPLVMTVAVIMFVVAFFVGEKIMNIEV